MNNQFFENLGERNKQFLKKIEKDVNTRIENGEEIYLSDICKMLGFKNIKRDAYFVLVTKDGFKNTIVGRS